MNEIGGRIKEAAEEVGGLNRLCDLIGVPRRTLGNWLRGTAPKPEALRKIAEVTDVNLSWLIANEGQKYTPERLLREAEEERERDDFSSALSTALRKAEHSKRRANPLYDHQVSIRAARFDIALLERIARMVTTAHKDLSIRITPEKVSAEAGSMYNLLMARLIDPDDQSEIEATLPQLEHLLRKRLSEAKASPGSGKRSA